MIYMICTLVGVLFGVCIAGWRKVQENGGKEQGHLGGTEQAELDARAKKALEEFSRQYENILSYNGEPQRRRGDDA